MKNDKEKKFNQKKSPEKCAICGKVLEGLVITDIWGNRVHHRHNPIFCSICSRILSKKTSAGAYKYSDGRPICGYCKDSAVISSWTTNRLKRQVISELKKIGLKDIPNDFKLSLVDCYQLAKYSQLPNAKGAVLTQVKYEAHKQRKMEHHIFILYGLPKVEFKAVVAHELLHIWLNIHDFKWSPMYTEGFCNLGSYWFYSKDKSDLAAHLLEHLIKNKHPHYGDGFRLMLRKLQESGWRRLIKESLSNREGFQESLWRKIFGKKLR